jgi:hypothetical protein
VNRCSTRRLAVLNPFIELHDEFQHAVHDAVLVRNHVAGVHAGSNRLSDTDQRLAHDQACAGFARRAEFSQQDTAALVVARDHDVRIILANAIGHSQFERVAEHRLDRAVRVPGEGFHVGLTPGLQVSEQLAVLVQAGRVDDGRLLQRIADRADDLAVQLVQLAVFLRRDVQHGCFSPKGLWLGIRTCSRCHILMSNHRQKLLGHLMYYVTPDLSRYTKCINYVINMLDSLLSDTLN